MDAPRLEDFGLKGTAHRPMPDFENYPITPEERAEAIEEIIRRQVGNERSNAFRLAEFDYEYGIRKK